MEREWKRRGGKRGDKKGSRRLCLQIDPNLYIVSWITQAAILDFRYANPFIDLTQTHTILTQNPNLYDIGNHVTTTCVAITFPNMSPKLNDTKIHPSCTLYTTHT